MSLRPDPDLAKELGRDCVIEELDRILRSQWFTGSPRSSRFLRHVVEQSLAGRLEELKEYAIGVEVFDRPPSFDPGHDPIVRVQARRLRQRLGDYYADGGQRDMVLIDVPKGSYAPRFRQGQGQNRLTADPAASTIARAARPWAGVVAVAVFGAMLGYLLRPESSSERLGFTERALTFGPGREGAPSFSPDGTRVAYHLDGDTDGQRDIYVLHLEPGSGEPVRVTTDPRDELHPAWSPDGTKIVFARFLEQGQSQRLARFQLVLVSPVEGSRERVLDEFVTRSGQALPSWSPDGRHIAFSCHIEAPASLRQICIYFLETREVWPVTFPDGDVGDGHVMFRPDGQAIAYQDYQQGLRLLELSQNLRPKGKPRTLTQGLQVPDPVGWSPDGRILYFSAELQGEPGLWSIRPNSDAAPQLLRSLSRAAGLNPSFWRSPSGQVQFVYEERDEDSDIMRVDLTQKLPVPTSLTRAARPDFNPVYSPDGSRIAFMSNRTGLDALFTCNRDGSEQELLVEFDIFAGSSRPSWSPDGTRIAIDAIFRTRTRDIYIIDIASKRAGPPLTDGGGRWSSWSRDGKFLYYTPGNTHSTWKLNVLSGEKEPVLHEYGSGPFVESVNSRTLYFRNASDLMRVPLDENRHAAGNPQTVARRIASFAVAEEGVYWMDLSGRVSFQDERSGRIDTVIELPFRFRQGQSGMSVSPDGETLLYTRWGRVASDLKLLESMD